jgi:hypothetical protein
VNRLLARALAIAVSVSAVLAAGGCTVVHIQGATKDDVAVYTKFGIVNVELKPGARSVVVDSSGFGAINALDGFTLGYQRSTYAALAPDDCRIVLWIRSDEQLKELNKFLSDRSNVCVVHATQTKGETP